MLGTPLNIRIDPPLPVFPGVADYDVGEIEEIVFKRNMTTEGRAGIGIVVVLSDGRTVVGQTTYRLFNTAARAIAASPAASEET